MIGSGIWNISARSWGRWGWPGSRQTRGSVQLGGWRYGIWASTWVMGRCVPKLTRRLQLRPAQVPRPKRRWDSSWGWRDIIGGLFLIFRTSPADLTKKEAPDPVQWTELCQQALTKVKAALCGGPVLHSPNFDLPFLLQTDASDRGLGAVLAQVAVADFLSRNGGRAAGRRAHRPEMGGGGMWRGARGKAERARGRAGLETSGETFGKWVIINTCIWFQWLLERHKRAPPAGREESSSEHADSERDRQKKRRKHPRRRDRTGSIYVLFWCLFLLLNADLWLVTLDFLVLLPWTPNLATMMYEI